jgi:hypothetical protein
MGRNVMYKKEPKDKFSHMVPSYLNPKQYKWLRQEMRKTGWTQTELIRALIDRKMREAEL